MKFLELACCGSANGTVRKESTTLRAPSKSAHFVSVFKDSDWPERPRNNDSVGDKSMALKRSIGGGDFRCHKMDSLYYCREA